MDPLLRIADLQVTYSSRRRSHRAGKLPPIRAVNGVSLDVTRGETFGLVGESGSGKSTVARAVLQLVRPSGGTIELSGRDVTSVDRRSMLEFRRHIQGVLQDPFSSLNQVHTVSTIVGDAITRHRGVARGSERDDLVVGLLEAVGLSRNVIKRHPYELSGGQCQRVSIARALAVEPDLIIADEPTSALDVSTQSQLINLFRQIQRERGVGFLMIGHNLDVIRCMSQSVGVMYLGYLVEAGPAAEVYESPSHPYTHNLMAAVPVADPVIQDQRRALRKALTLDAEAPSPANLPQGCPFANRCPVAMEICHSVLPDPVPCNHGGFSRCHLHTSGPCLGGASVAPYIVSRISFSTLYNLPLRRDVCDRAVATGRPSGIE